MQECPLLPTACRILDLAPIAQKYANRGVRTCRNQTFPKSQLLSHVQKRILLGQGIKLQQFTHF